MVKVTVQRGGCCVYKEAREVKTVAVTKRVSLTDTRSIVISYAGAVTGDPTAPVVVSPPSLSLPQHMLLLVWLLHTLCTL